MTWNDTQKYASLSDIVLVPSGLWGGGGAPSRGAGLLSGHFSAVPASSGLPHANGVLPQGRTPFA